jgi:hypothetical protein
MLVSRRLALLASVVPLVACGSPKVLMRFHPKAATYRFVMQEDMKGSLSGGAGSASLPVGEASVGGQFTEAIGGPRDGGIGVIWTIDTLTVKSAQQKMAARAESTLAARLAQIKAMSFDVVYDDRMIPMKEQVNDPTAASGRDPDAPSALRSAAHSFAFPLPREPLGKGDTWRAADDLALPGLTGGGAVQVQYELTVKDILVNGADTSVVIGITAKFPDTPLPLNIQGLRLQAKLSGSTTGEETFSLTQGALTTGTLNGTVKVDLTIPTLQAPIAMSYDMHVTMKRAGP